MNFKRSVPIVLGGAAAVLYGYLRTGPASNLPSEEAMNLKQSYVNRFHCFVIDFPASANERSQKSSDLFLYTSLGLAALLMLEKKIRKDWKEVGIWSPRSPIYKAPLRTSQLIYLSIDLGLLHTIHFCPYKSDPVIIGIIPFLVVM